jgi:RHS repeat-associated protein
MNTRRLRMRRSVSALVSSIVLGAGLPVAQAVIAPPAAHAVTPVQCSIPQNSPWGLQPTTRDSVNPSGGDGDSYSQEGSLSTAGRYSAFFSNASNLVSGDTNTLGDVFVRDRQTRITTRASVGNDQRQANGTSYNPVISSDGRYVAFTSSASNLLGGDQDTAMKMSFAPSYMQMPASLLQGATTETVEAWFNTTGSGPIVSMANAAYSSTPSSYDDIIYVDTAGKLRGNFWQGTVGTIVSTASVNDGKWHHVALVGAGTNTLLYLDGALVGQRAGTINQVSMTVNYVGFGYNNSAWPSLTNGWTSFSGTIDDVSVTRSALSATRIAAHYAARSGESGSGYASAVLADAPYAYYRLGEATGTSAADSSGNARTGTYSAVTLGALGALTVDANNTTDVFVRDLVAQTTQRVSVATDGTEGNGASASPVISSDGRWVAFSSAATNLVANDLNAKTDVFLRDRTTATTTRESLMNNGTIAGNGDSWPVAIASDGQRVAFESKAWNLIGGDMNTSWDPSYGEVNIPHNAAFNLTGNLTLEGWIWTDSSVGTTQMIVTKDLSNGSTNNTFELRLDPSGIPQFLQYAGGAVRTVNANKHVPFDQWVHVAVTKSGTTVTHYINGAAAGTGTISGTVTTNMQPVRIATRDDIAGTTNAYHFAGALDEIAVYPSALSSARVTAHYQARTTSYSSTVLADAPTGYWRLGEASGTTAADASGHSYSGTYSGTYALGYASALSGDGNVYQDVFTRDRVAGLTDRVDVGAGGAITDADSYGDGMSADGRYITFDTWADNVETPTYAPGQEWIYTRDRTAATTTRSVTVPGGASAGGSAYGGSLAADGSVMSFTANTNRLLGGDVDTSANFDSGDGQYVDIPDGYSDFTPGLTIEAWANPVGAENFERILDFGNGGPMDNVILSRRGTTNDVGFYVYRGTTLVGQVFGPNALIAGQWQHIVATMSSAGAVTIYRNGVSIATGTTQVPNVVTRTGNFIGKSGWSASPTYFHGRLDEVGIYNKALSAAQVAAHYNARFTSYFTAVKADAPLGYWRLGDVYTSTTAVDSATTPHNGTYTSVYGGFSIPGYDGALVADQNLGNDVFFATAPAGSGGTISLASQNSSSAQANGGSESVNSAISPDGRSASFESSATNLADPPGTADGNAQDDRFTRDRGALSGPLGLSPGLTGLVAQSDENGLEQFYPYASTNLGTGTAYAHLRTGNLVVQHTDANVPGVGLNAVIKRTYNSGRQSIDEGLGGGWSLSVGDVDAGLDSATGGTGNDNAAGDIDLNAPLKFGSYGSIVNGLFQAAGAVFEFTDGDGTTHRFVRNGPPCGRWSSPPGVSLKVIEEVDSLGLTTGLDLVRPDGVSYHAEPLLIGGLVPTPTEWHITHIDDRKGNRLTYSYQQFGPLGTSRISTITHNRYPTAPIVRFDYTAAGNLSQIVTLPGYSAADPATGNTRSWERDIAVNVDATNHRLTSVTENTQTTPANGQRTTSYGYSGNSSLLTTASDGLVVPHQTTFGYTNGQVTTISDRRQKTWTYSYPTAGSTGTQTTTVTSPVGAVTTYQTSGRAAIGGNDQRIAGHNITQISDAGTGSPAVPITTTYAWTANRLTTSTDGAGDATSFEYNDLGLPTKITKPAPNTSDNPLTPGTEDTAPVVSKLQYSYPADYTLDPSNCTDPGTGGPVSSEGWCSAAAELVRTTSADSVSAERRITDYTHDSSGNTLSVTQRANPDPNQLPSDPPGAADRATTMTYYARGSVKTVDGPRTDVADVTTFGDTADATYGGFDHTGQPLMVTDARGKQTTYGYTPYGPTAKTTDRDGRVTTAVYDERNNALTLTDPAGHATTFLYDGNDNRTKATKPIDPNKPSELTYVQWGYDPDDRVSTVTTPGATSADPARVINTTYFDDGTVQAAENARNQATNYSYWPDRLLKTEDAPASGSNRAVTDHYYDAAGRENKRVSPATNIAGNRPEVKITYNPNGSVAKTEATSSTGADDRVTNLAYDANGEQTHNDGPRQVGGVSEQTDTTYDNFGQALDQTRKESSTQTVHFTRTYDLAGNLKTQSQPTGNGGQLVTSNTYDVLNRLTHHDDPVNSTHTVDYTYSDEGLQTARTDSVSGTAVRTMAITYNADRSVSSLVATQGSDVHATCNYDSGQSPASGYDVDGNLLVSRTVLGNDCSAAVTPDRRQTYVYDDRGLVTSSRQEIKSPQTGQVIARDQSYVSGTDGRWTSATHDGNTTNFTYTPAGWLDTVTDWRQKATTETYFSSGAVATRSVGTATASSSYDWTPDGALGSLTWRQGSAGNVVRQHTAVAYDIGGLRTSEQVQVRQPNSSTLDGTTSTNSYDLLGRVSSFASPFIDSDAQDRLTTSLALDDGGNATNETTSKVGGGSWSATSSTYASGLLTTANVDEPPTGIDHVDTFGYDALGEQSSQTTDPSGTEPQRQTRSTTYDAMGHTKTVDDTTLTDDDVTYSYDAAGHLISRVEPNAVRNHLQIDAGSAVASTADSSALTLTGDLDVRAAANLGTVPAEGAVLVAQYSTSGTGRQAYALRVLSDGRPELQWWPSGGSSYNLATATTAAAVQPGQILAIRATLKLNDGNGHRVITFFGKSTTPERVAVDIDKIDDGWTQIGQAVTQSGTTSVADSSSPLTVGAYDGGPAQPGTYYGAEVRNGIGGTVIAAPDFSKSSEWGDGATQATDRTSKLWTLTGSTAHIADEPAKATDRATTTLYFYWGGSQSLAEETDGAGLPLARYVPDGNGSTLAQLTFQAKNGARDTSDSNGTWRWLLPDASGNVATLLKDDGSVDQQEAWDPYGRPKAAGSTSADVSQWASSLGFQGSLFDRATGASLLGPRQYDPKTARFTTPDQFVGASLDLGLGTDPLTGNRYLFAGANPVAFYENGYFPCWHNSTGGCHGATAVHFVSDIPASAGDAIREYYADWQVGWKDYPTPLKVLGTALIAVSVTVLAPELLPDAVEGGVVGEDVLADSEVGSEATMSRDYALGDPGEGALGSTDKFGNITIREGLSEQDFIETLRHETVHSILSPSNEALANARMYLYQNSQLWRFAEEAAAETYGTGSLIRGLTFPFASAGYGLSFLGVGAEGAAVGAAGYGTYRLWKSL